MLKDFVTFFFSLTQYMVFLPPDCWLSACLSIPVCLIELPLHGLAMVTIHLTVGKILPHHSYIYARSVVTLSHNCFNCQNPNSTTPQLNLT